MWIQKVLILIFCLVFFAKGEDESPKEDGPLTVYDLTFSSSSTDSLRIYLVVGSPSDYHIYNISKAVSLLSDNAFRKDYRTVLYVHGFNDKPGRLTGPRIVEAYQARGRHNILLLDSSSLVTLEYFRSSRAVRYAGIRLGKVLSQFYNSKFNMDTLDLVGHSLGAHLLGFAGKTYLKSTGKLLPRITGLDVAGPCFKGANPDGRLSKDDAEFVQVLHTNAGSLGMRVPIGHIDFYINGGRNQPPVFGLICLMGCSHDRVIDIWKFAVLYPNKFVGIQCSKLKEVEQDQCFQRGRKAAILGPTADPRTKGIYYVRTANREPFFIGLEEMRHFRNC
ncbi:lipase member H-like [Arctopsyche grandis]|uniref:lipase member H-like n=1 Tax=Arctopsyche grandis TaxID=121162 RepID=UPI00406DA260